MVLRNEDTKTILIIDQYEETLSNGIGTTPWTNFESKMAELVGAEQARLDAGEDPRFKLILVVRSDYELLLHGMEHPLQEWWTAGRLGRVGVSHIERCDSIVKRSTWCWSDSGGVMSLLSITTCL